jgi:hypothetical protein
MLHQYAPRYQEVVNEFHAIQDNIPPTFKQAFARYELEKKGFPPEQINDDENLFGDVPGETEIDLENQIGHISDLTLHSLLRECGKDNEYIKTEVSRIAAKLGRTGFDFMNDELCVEFKKGGRGATETQVKFTPKGYLCAIVKFSDRFLGKEFRSKYVNFLLNSATFTAKLDLIYTEQMRALQNRNGELSLQNNQMRQRVRRATLALTDTTNRTNLSYWAHLTNMCKTEGKVAPVFSPNWNRNAQLLQDLRKELSAAGRVHKPSRSAWLYRDAGAKNYVINQFQQLGLS